MKTKNISPCDNITTISVDGIFENRGLRYLIEKYVASDSISDDMNEECYAAKKASDMIKGEKLYDEGKILEAANLGYPEAMGEMASNYVNGIDSFEVDYA